MGTVLAPGKEIDKPQGTHYRALGICLLSFYRNVSYISKNEVFLCEAERKNVPKIQWF